MIHHVALFKLNPDTPAETLELMMRETRAQLLKINEVLSLQCGRVAHAHGEEGQGQENGSGPGNWGDWDFFLMVDVESLEKLELYRESAVHIKFVERILKPNTCARMTCDFESDPAREPGENYSR